MQGPPSKKGPRVNDMIQETEVRLIDEEGNNHGAVPLEAALKKAAAANLDLVEISPNVVPPVCKILDYGRYKYEAQKKANVARKKQKTVEIKEIKVRPGIEKHDYDVKMRAVDKFLAAGDKVKVTLRFRGREMAHQDLGINVLHRIREDLSDRAKVEQMPKMDGRQVVMLLAPKN